MPDSVVTYFGFILLDFSAEFVKVDASLSQHFSFPSHLPLLSFSSVIGSKVGRKPQAWWLVLCSLPPILSLGHLRKPHGLEYHFYANNPHIFPPKSPFLTLSELQNHTVSTVPDASGRISGRQLTLTMSKIRAIDFPLPTLFLSTHLNCPPSFLDLKPKNHPCSSSASSTSQSKTHPKSDHFPPPPLPSPGPGHLHLSPGLPAAS